MERMVRDSFSASFAAPFGGSLASGGEHRFELVELGVGEALGFEHVDQVLVHSAIEDFFKKAAGELAEGRLPLDERDVDVGLADP